MVSKGDILTPFCSKFIQVTACKKLTAYYSVSQTIDVKTFFYVYLFLSRF